MDKYRLNINKAKGDIKTLYHAAWLFSEKKHSEIILEVDDLNKLPALLKIELMILSEGIINSDESKPRREIDFESITVNDYNSLAFELSKITGLKFLVELMR
jgi:hypothetical protein